MSVDGGGGVGSAPHPPPGPTGAAAPKRQSMRANAGGWHLFNSSPAPIIIACWQGTVVGHKWRALQKSGGGGDRKTADGDRKTADGGSGARESAAEATKKTMKKRLAKSKKRLAGGGGDGSGAAGQRSAATVRPMQQMWSRIARITLDLWF